MKQMSKWLAGSFKRACQKCAFISRPGWRTGIVGLGLVGCMGLGQAQAQQPKNTANYEVARLKATLQQVVQEHERIVGLMEQNRQVTQAIIKRLVEVEKKAGQASNQSRVNLATKADIQALQNQIAIERKAREQAIAELIRSVSREISRASSVSNAGGGNSGGPSQGVYTVVGGDTLSTIAQAFGVSVKALKKANNLTDDIIRVEQKLTIPAK